MPDAGWVNRTTALDSKEFSLVESPNLTDGLTCGVRTRVNQGQQSSGMSDPYGTPSADWNGSSLGKERQGLIGRRRHQAFDEGLVQLSKNEVAEGPWGVTELAEDGRSTGSVLSSSRTAAG